MALDRLNSFAGLIRTLWQSRAQSAQTAAAPASRSEAPPLSAARIKGNSDELHERLRSRLRGLSRATREQRCEAFVETVLLWELSETIGGDPGFSGVVSHVTRELTSDPRVSARLDEVLVELSSTVPPTPGG